MKTNIQETLPMTTSGTQHLIDRTYRESGRYQWAREALMNSLEAGATKVHFGIEWQAVERKGVYRRTIADNGKGMTPDQLVEFFNVFGGAGKPIGGVHENFGVGSKTSLLPWNRHGMVVVSWVGGEAAMIWVRQDRQTGEYGLKLFRTREEGSEEETLEAVVDPFRDPRSGVNWAELKPDWIKDHGTVMALMGDNAEADTVIGDPNRDEADLKGLASYLNRRVWEIPAGTEVTVDELRTSDRKLWPKSETEDDARTNRRTIQGAHHYITYETPHFSKGSIVNSGVLTLKDNTKVHWFLWGGDRPSVHSYAANQGFISALYNNELYDTTAHLAVYRNFGVTDPDVRHRLWLVLEPEPFDERKRRGVYPRTDRSALLLRGGPDAGGPLPYQDWGAEFSDAMPEPIKEALRAAHQEAASQEVNPKWRDILAERFGDRWRIPKLRAVVGPADLTVDPNQSGGEPVVKPRRPKEDQIGGDRVGTIVSQITGTHGPKVVGSLPGKTPAEQARLGVSIPSYRLAKTGEIETGMIAAWSPKDPEYPEGVVLLNREHPVLLQQLDYWRQHYADHLAPEVEQEVLNVYGQVAVAKVAHSEKLKGILPAEVVEKDLRSEHALTMGLLGLMAEEALIAARPLGARFGKRRVVEPPVVA